ncbi:MAG: PIN domain-containing protein, partial [Nocardioidaceae bacterium]
VAPDTNVFLHHPQFFTDVDWPGLVEARPHEDVELVVPILVLGELDHAKRGRAEVRSRARQTLRRFDEMFHDPAAPARLEAPGGNHDIRVHLLADDPQHVRLPDADAELIDRLSALKQLVGREVVLVSLDTSMALRARTAGLNVCKLEDT